MKGGAQSTVISTGMEYMSCVAVLYGTLGCPDGLWYAFCIQVNVSGAWYWGMGKKVL